MIANIDVIRITVLVSTQKIYENEGFVEQSPEQGCL